MTTLQWVMNSKIIAIVRGLQPRYIENLANALLAGGIDMMEVTFDQAKPDTWRDTANAIRIIHAHTEGKMLAGAGTVLTEEQLHIAVDAGAKYMLSPNTRPILIQSAKAQGLCVFSGAMTPSEVFDAYEAGADAVKIFPAGVLGVPYIKAIRAPLNGIPMLAVGGINERNLGDFIQAGCCGVGVGGNLVNNAWIQAGAWSEITDLAKAYRKAVV